MALHLSPLFLYTVNNSCVWRRRGRGEEEREEREEGGRRRDIEEWVGRKEGDTG